MNTALRAWLSVPPGRERLYDWTTEHAVGVSSDHERAARDMAAALADDPIGAEATVRQVVPTGSGGYAVVRYAVARARRAADGNVVLWWADR